MARPRKQIDPQQITELAKLGCSGEEIATILRCSRDLLYKRFSTLIKEGHENMRTSLRRAQYISAVDKGNVVMQIWLGKQHLGQVDKQEVKGTFEHRTNDLSHLSEAELAQVEAIVNSANKP